MKKTLSPKQVARALGVSESSLKRWCDKGLLTTTRTAGGHRRVAVENVLRFLRDSGHPLREPELLGVPIPPLRGARNTIEALQPVLLRALLAGDQASCERILLDLYLAATPMADLGDRLIAPVFVEIGERWSDGRVDVFVERRAVEACLRGLHRLRDALPDVPATDAPMALGAAPEGDPYQLSTTLVELTLRALGWGADSYGVGIPLDSLGRALEERKPKLFWLSVSHLEPWAEDGFVAGFQRLYETAAGLGVAVAVGGRGLVPALRDRMRYSAYCDRLQHLVAFSQALQGQAVPPAERS